jgi:hypothetical protein
MVRENVMCGRIERILRKLEHVRESGISCFGSEKHGWRLNPVLPEAVISAFESEHGIRLPDDYRQFLSRAGNGGAGPYYGILPLARWHSTALWVDFDDEEKISRDYLARSCPLHPGMSRAETWEEDLAHENLGFSWDSYYQGTITLVEQGCTYCGLLVVSGPAAGRVVYVDVQRCGPPYFVENVDFLSWYERWLDELLAGYKIGWFGFGMAGSETELRQTLASDQSAERRAAAAKAMLRLPSLSESTASTIMAAAADSDPRVRAAIVNLRARFSLRLEID